MKKENIIIFGASRLGEIAFNILKDKYNICYFCDNNKEKWNKLFCGFKTINPLELINYKDYKIIIASMYYGEISVQLKKIGMKDINIFTYNNIDDKTYSKRYFIDKMCDLEIYNNLNLNLEYKTKFIENFSLIYGSDAHDEYKVFEKVDNGKKNVLFSAYFFPPIGGSSVQRTLKFIKYLKEYGWDPTVVTVGNEYCIDEKDISLMKEIPSNINVNRINHEYINTEQLDYKTAQQILNLVYGVIEDEDLASKYLSTIKGNDCIERIRIFEPEVYISWVNSVLSDIEKIINIKDMDIIYTTSSPYSNHFIGYYIKKKYNIPWVADFRDEWTNNHNAQYFYKNDKARLELHKHLERNIVNFADKVITVSPTSSENYRKMFNLPYEKVVTITNGYDEEDFKYIPTNKNNNIRFIIIYYGSLYLDRSLEDIIISLNELIEEGLINRKLVEIKIIGKVDLIIKDKLLELDKYKLVKYIDYLPHLACLEETNDSNLLLLPFGDGDAFKVGYTGKIFEYIRLMIPILSLSPKESEIENLLKETKCGENFEYDDLFGIKNYILKQYSNWISGVTDFDVNKSKIQEYERKKLTGKLSEIFHSLI